MKHVLGIGTYWTVWDGEKFVPNPEFHSETFRYLGDAGNAANLLVGQSGKARIEDEFGPGTKSGHWDEAIYNRELMTGFAEFSPPMPLSVLTIGALEDLGHTVNYDAADPYTVTGSRNAEGNKVQLKGCELLNFPPKRLDKNIHAVKGREADFYKFQSRLARKKKGLRG